MAQQSHYQRVELLKTEELGVGPYGAVYKAMCDDLPCAAKILHHTLFQFTAPGATSVMRNFEQECRLLSAIKHPHIVQYLGTYHDPESRLPVLLMELMDESLTRFLERSREPLPYHTEVNLCHDIALALSYLHSNGIIHRDLSSNNVLLIAGSRAKVTDFGMVKLYDVNCSTAHLTPLTPCPGTLAYMPPEALRDGPVYTNKLDSFSLGVLCVQIMTRQFPDPSNRVSIVEDSRFPTGKIEVPVPETQRRRLHIDLIDPAHPLLPIALDCLKDKDRERPSCHEFCGRVSTLKASPKYTESVQQSQVNTKLTQQSAQQSQPQYEFRYQRVELLKTEEIGVGSYGAVCKAMCDNLPCAAKLFHPALFQFTAPGNTSVMRKFEQECRLLSAIKHPHIVQYLGTYHDPESKLPVLLMELMDESLTRFLERSYEPLPYHTEVNLCHDIALALSYLHSNGIVHRDLSSNNVLLIAGSRAKVTDFGMVKLYNVKCSTAHLMPFTLCPGKMAYMSPEALGEPPMYTDKLDSFSLGVLCVQIMTRQSPDPGDHVIEVKDSRYPTSKIEMPVPEIDRRQSHIDLIDPAHPLLQVALDCLRDRDRERPSCHELCSRMSTLKASPKYTESVQQSQVDTKPTQQSAQQSQPQYEFRYQRVELLKTEEIGIGSYGAVCKAMCDNLPCAAKILHRTLFQFTAPGATSVMRNFEQECRLLSAIKHPHIVQYLSTYYDPESKLPVLLMELMDESLTRFLKRSHEPLSYHTEVNLCHDIALALSHLHSNGIVHRDLSSNNVLLIAGSRAKVTDFGMAKLYDVNRSTAHLIPLTLCPGTTVYMAPEALQDQPVYTDKLDSFSLGVLCVQIMTRQFPDPSNRVSIVEDSRFPTGKIEVPVPETQRRRLHIDLIDPAHPLLPIALDCLKDKDRERPSCHEFCGRVSTLKASPKYTESVQQSQVNTKPTQQSAQQSQPQYEFRYQKVELLKTEEIGVGSYGAVCKAMCDNLPCAAKILHRTLFQFTAPGNTSVMRKFEQECRLLSIIKHPHIVQYLGTYHDPESKLPVLLMELLDESLTQFLKRSHEPLSYHTEVNLCHDIALALSYLHSNGIIHRDLSSNNVLLIAGSRAKVTDFGMAKLYDVNRSTAHLTPLTLCPGTTVYMAPEALQDQPVYTDKLDSFSLGVLCVQIMTQQFPDPSNRVSIVEDSRFPTGKIEVPVPETQRRRLHIDLIDPAHPLLPIALDCLKDIDRERPSCHELCGRVSTLKAAHKYTESVEQSQVDTKPTQSANRESTERELQQSQQIRELQQQLRTKDDQLREKEQENQQQRQQNLKLRTLLTAKDEQLAGKDHQLQQKEVAMAAHQQEIQQLRQQLQPSEQLAAEFQQNLLERGKMNQDLQRPVLELQQQLRQRGGQRREEEEASGAAASGNSIKLRWRDGGRAPCEMWGEVSAVDGSVAYFQPWESKSVFSYNSTSKKWSNLSKCPNSYVSLAMVNSLLTAIGGTTSNYEVTNSLLSLTDNKWTKQFPPMPTKRCLTLVVCSGGSLVVAGGVGEGDKYLSTVEVMDTKTLQWSTASSLPHPLSEASATLCGDQVYMLGGFYQSGKQSKSVFTCSLIALLQSCQPQSLRARLRTLSLASRPKVWHQLADTPVTLSTCASLHGRLLAVGGNDPADKKTTAIHMYNTTTNSWKVISHMTTPRYRCLVAVLPHNELMVVGGFTTYGNTDSVEIASII